MYTCRDTCYIKPFPVSAAICDLPLIPTSHSNRTILVALSDPENIGLAIGISLPACVQFKLTQLETCMASVHAWLQMNGLQLNPNKSEVIQVTATRGRN